MNRFGKTIVSAVSERKNVIFNNPLMSLFLDPRFGKQIVGDSNKMQQAKDTLLNIWRRMIALSSTPITVDTSTNISHASKSSDDFGFEYNAQAELNKHFASEQQNKSTEGNVLNSSEIDIEMLLDTYDPNQIPPGNDILEYWEEK